MTRTALHRAADYLRTDMTKYKIDVPINGRVFIRRGLVTPVDLFTPYQKCLTLLRAAIREEKRLEQEKLNENQGKLL